MGTTPVHVIPCAVDLERFATTERRNALPTLVYGGSVGMWYALDAMLDVFAAARVTAPALRFLILNVGQHELIHARVAAFEEMSGLLRGAHVAICLLNQTPSKLGSSPIKVAEYLACGLPVIANAGQDDTDDFLGTYRAGHMMNGYSDEEIARAASALVALLGDREARENARALAEREFSAERAAADYLRIYEAIVAR